MTIRRAPDANGFDIDRRRTEYSGVLFESQLEARWAVAFDYLGVEWNYQPDYLDLNLVLKSGTDHYLPDFYLPQADVRVEVKGVLTDASYDRLLNRAAALDRPLLVLGLLKDVPSTALPVVLSMRGNTLVARVEPTKGVPMATVGQPIERRDFGKRALVRGVPEYGQVGDGVANRVFATARRRALMKWWNNGPTAAVRREATDEERDAVLGMWRYSSRTVASKNVS